MASTYRNESIRIQREPIDRHVAFQLHPDLSFVMGITESVMFCDLMDLFGQTPGDRFVVCGGKTWMFCSEEFLTNRHMMRWTKATSYRALNSLRSKGYIQTKKIDGWRHIRLDVDKAFADAAAAKKKREDSNDDRIDRE